MTKQRALSLEEKLNQNGVKERIKSTFIKKEKTGPWVIELDPTTACNLACHDCISANLLNQGGIDPKRLLKLAEEFKDIGVKAVVLIGGGEPMAHKEFGNLVKAFAEKDIHIGVTTNGTLMKKYMDVCLEYLSWLRVSVDAGSPEVFNQFRPHASGRSQFDLVINNMKELGQRKKGIMGYSFLLLSKFDKSGKLENTNAVDIEKAGNIAKDIGCDYFEVKPAFDLMHYLQSQDTKVTDIANKQLAAIKKLNSGTFQVIAPYTLDEALKGVAVQPKEYERCLVQDLRTVVSPSGVYVCPYHRGNLNMRIGDITKQSFKEIWHSQKRKEVRDRVNPKNHCGFHCIRDGSNKFLEKIISGEEALDKNKANNYDRFI